METTVLENDIPVFYKTATSYPDGILDAHRKLHALVSFTTDRRYFGVSRPEDGGDIVYRAAAEELKPGEGKSFGCDSLILKKGKYISLIIHEYMKDPQSIEQAFQKLLTHPDLDRQGYCVEWYLNEKDVKCMVRLEE
jgi:hypothetical protein